LINQSVVVFIYTCAHGKLHIRFKALEVNIAHHPARLIIFSATHPDIH